MFGGNPSPLMLIHIPFIIHGFWNIGSSEMSKSTFVFEVNFAVDSLENDFDRCRVEKVRIILKNSFVSVTSTHEQELLLFGLHVVALLPHSWVEGRVTQPR